MKELLKANIAREWLLMKRNSFVYIFKMVQVSNEVTLTYLLISKLTIQCLTSKFLLVSAHTYVIDHDDSLLANQDAS